MWQIRLHGICYPQRAAVRFHTQCGRVLSKEEVQATFPELLWNGFFFPGVAIAQRCGLADDFTWTTVQHTDTGCDQLCCLPRCINQQQLGGLLHEISLGAPLNAWWWPRNKNRKPSPLLRYHLVDAHFWWWRKQKQNVVTHLRSGGIKHLVPNNKNRHRLETTTAKNLKYIKHPCLGKSDRVLAAGTLEMWNRKKISATKSYMSTFN